VKLLSNWPIADWQVSAGNQIWSDGSERSSFLVSRLAR